MGNDFLFCCLSEEEKERLEKAVKNKQYAVVYELQSHIKDQKKAYCCERCKKTYPKRRISYKNKISDAENFKKFTGEVQKYKGVAKDGYYWLYVKNCLKKCDEKDGSVLAEVKIMSSALYLKLSEDRKYAAAENLNGTIEVYDLTLFGKIGRKAGIKASGRFLFAGSDLVCFGGRILKWDLANNVFEEGADAVPIFGENKRVLCTSFIFNANSGKYVLELWCDGKTVLAESDFYTMRKVRDMGKRPSCSKIIYNLENKSYTVPYLGYCSVLNEDLEETECFEFPHLLKYTDGGGRFPVTLHEISNAECVYISPDGKWLALDYFTALMLVRRSDGEIVYCLFDHTGKTVSDVGFTEENELRYCWGKTVYVHRLKDL